MNHVIVETADKDGYAILTCTTCGRYIKRLPSKYQTCVQWEELLAQFLIDHSQ